VPNILAQLSSEKQWVGGGGWAGITLAPHYQYRLSINRRVWEFGLMPLTINRKTMGNFL
jgi:hypothetical protein